MPETEQPDTWREALDSALALQEAKNAEAEEPKTEPKAEPKPAEEPKEGKAEPAPAEGEKGRDDKGRFVKGAADKTGVADQQGREKDGKATAQGAVGTATKPAAAVGERKEQLQSPELLRPPKGWTPAQREEWPKVPRTAQEAILRREREVAVALQDSAAHREVAEAWQQVISPFEANIRAQGGDIRQTVQTLLQTAAQLGAGPPATKAAIVAQIITGYGVSIEDLANALDGKLQPGGGAQAPGFDPNQFAQQLEQRILNGFEQRQNQYWLNQAQDDVETWGDDKEFFDDVRGRMGWLMEAAAHDGIAMDFEQAYSLACSADPEISGVLQQREEATRAQAANASTQRAKEAASSIRSQPAGTEPTAEPNTWRDALSRAYEEQMGR